MSYLPTGMPVPEPGPEDAPFWQACQDQQLKIRFCDNCSRHFHPPLPSCPRCGSMHVSWRELSGNGTIFTYSVGYHAVHPALKGHPPYNVSVVLLDDADDVRLVTNIVDVPPDELSIGMPVTVCWEDAGNGTLLPRFRRTTSDVGGSGSAA
ncbi:Zn-ribbon domain-containing OB-fold protein [Burkholderia sp. S171]|uniref:Zn-ribbon domain-containing OB-fold protein n=1 Tax=Burkholderia sp. S171 TaxID=1641860 RepID=UPI00131AF91D|nr:OB-fold domain-containing protein [Burkholderia sp. S171]